MAVTIAILMLAVFIILYSVIIAVFTILFRLTGMTQEKARTQVISMLTNCGFTTSESEVIMSSRIRRRLLKITVLFGYSFTVVIISSVLNLFLSLSSAQLEDLLPSIISIVLLIIASYILFNTKIIRVKFDKLIEHFGNKIMFSGQTNPIVLIDTYGENAMAEVMIEIIPDELRDITLGNSGFRERYNVQLLNINRKNTDNVELNANTMIRKNDIILLFGNYSNIKQIFETKTQED